MTFPKMFEVLTFAMFALVADVAMAQAYKCKDSSGVVRYQQSPCVAAGEEKVRLFYDSSPDDVGLGRDSLAESLSPAVRAKFDTLVSEKRVAIGMTEKMVLRAWGRPKKINASIRKSGRSEQWVYESEYVYLDGGIVSSIQTSR